MRKSIAALVLTSVILCLFAGCSSGKSNTSKESGTSKQTMKDYVQAPAAQGGNNTLKKSLKLSAWTIYWDCENVLSETGVLSDKLVDIVYFAAYFDKDNKLFIPEKTAETFKNIKNISGRKRYTNYLSIVNDKVSSNSETSLKSTDLLKELFADENTQQSHMDDIVRIALESGFDGVEIDYEAIKKDTSLWNKFINFSSKLYEKLKDNRLKMRIVLEPSAPLEKLKFPDGPEYVMMCYNLHGASSKPGPKADKNFIMSLADKMTFLPGSKSFGFATGGFDWGESGKAKAITEKEANILLEKYGITPKRDKDSSALTFKYLDEKGSRHEVWYADGTTIATWINCIESKGYNNASLWRLNGNSEASLKLLIK